MAVHVVTSWMATRVPVTPAIQELIVRQVSQGEMLHMAKVKQQAQRVDQVLI